MSSTVLVTGANGYIGSNVAFAFRTAGFKVFALVRKQQDVARFIPNEVIPIIGDISKPETFKKELEEANRNFFQVYAKPRNPTYPTHIAASDGVT